MSEALEASPETKSWHIIEFDFDEPRLDWAEDTPHYEQPLGILGKRVRRDGSDEITADSYGKPIMRVMLNWIETSVPAKETIVEKATGHIQNWLAEIACSDVTFTEVKLRSIELGSDVNPDEPGLLKTVIPEDVTIEALAVAARLRAEATG